MGNMICEVQVRLSCKCKGCWGKVSRAVSKRVPGVKSINIDKDREVVTVRGEVHASAIVDAISTVKKATATIILVKPEEEAQPLPQPTPPPSPPSTPLPSPPPSPPMSYVDEPAGQHPWLQDAATQFQNLEIHDGYDQPDQAYNPGYGYSYTWQPAVPSPPPPQGNGNYSNWSNMGDENVSGSCSIM